MTSNSNTCRRADDAAGGDGDHDGDHEVTRGFPQALEEIPRGRWASWTPSALTVDSTEADELSDG